jgi:hypothetical protein
LVGVGICLLSLSLADAQTGSKCNATVTQKSFEASTRRERAWDIQFDVTVNECADSSGTFEYIVDLTEKGKTESETAKATFQTEKAGTTTITVTYQRAFKDLKGVRGVKVTSCTCGS